MKCLFWNLRGLANSPTKMALKKLLVVHKPDIFFVAEPWIDISKFSTFWLHKLGYKLFSVNNRGNLHPNLWCFCTRDINPVIVLADDQHVSFQLCVNGKPFGLATIYASTCHIRRRFLWETLTHIQSNHSIPWCLLGDFNSILGSHEQRSNFRPIPQPILDFQAWTDTNNLIHIPTRGTAFTWSNGRKGRFHIQRRLDRAICNQKWFDECNVVTCSTLTKLRSDHFPILLEFKNHNLPFVSQFKFLKMWVAHEDCINVVRNCWNTNIIGCPMFVLSEKLKLLKAALKQWNKDTFGNVNDQVLTAKQNLDNIQDEIDTLGPTDNLMLQEKNAQIKLEQALNIEEILWQQKSKVKWHCDGDRNTAYFHRVAKIKSASSLITSLNLGDTVITDTKEISEHIINHFSTLFNNTSNTCDNGLVDEVIPHLITDRINSMLTLLPSEDEIFQAIFSLNKDSAPGPDGFGALFFQTYWSIIKLDVTKAVLQFFSTGWILPNFNSNNIVLIPKINNAGTINDYRPIAIENFKFKIISKILADRLAKIMPANTSVQQRGFIKGRSIKDCICLTSEAINLLHKKSYGGNLSLKVDIAKAFDTLDWNFLLQVLRKFGFSDTFCKWIHSILISAKLSVSINGKMYGYFSCTRGVR